MQSNKTSDGLIVFEDQAAVSSDFAAGHTGATSVFEAAVAKSTAELDSDLERSRFQEFAGRIVRKLPSLGVSAEVSAVLEQSLNTELSPEAELLRNELLEATGLYDQIIELEVENSVGAFLDTPQLEAARSEKELKALGALATFHLMCASDPILAGKLSQFLDTPDATTQKDFDDLNGQTRSFYSRTIFSASSANQALLQREFLDQNNTAETALLSGSLSSLLALHRADEHTSLLQSFTSIFKESYSAPEQIEDLSASPIPQDLAEFLAAQAGRPSTARVNDQRIDRGAREAESKSEKHQISHQTTAQSTETDDAVNLEEELRKIIPAGRPTQAVPASPDIETARKQYSWRLVFYRSAVETLSRKHPEILRELLRIDSKEKAAQAPWYALGTRLHEWNVRRKLDLLTSYGLVRAYEKRVHDFNPYPEDSKDIDLLLGGSDFESLLQNTLAASKTAVDKGDRSFTRKFLEAFHKATLYWSGHRFHWPPRNYNDHFHLNDYFVE